MSVFISGLCVCVCVCVFLSVYVCLWVSLCSCVRLRVYACPRHRESKQGRDYWRRPLATRSTPNARARTQSTPQNCASTSISTQSTPQHQHNTSTPQSSTRPAFAPQNASQISRNASPSEIYPRKHCWEVLSGSHCTKKKQLNITGKHSNVDLYIINWYILLRITISYYIQLDQVQYMTLSICNERKGKGTKFRGLFYDLLETIKYMSVRCEGPM